MRDIGTTPFQEMMDPRSAKYDPNRMENERMGSRNEHSSRATIYRQIYGASAQGKQSAQPLAHAPLVSTRRWAIGMALYFLACMLAGLRPAISQIILTAAAVIATPAGRNGSGGGA